MIVALASVVLLAALLWTCLLCVIERKQAATTGFGVKACQLSAIHITLVLLCWFPACFYGDGFPTNQSPSYVHWWVFYSVATSIICYNAADLVLTYLHRGVQPRFVFHHVVFVASLILVIIRNKYFAIVYVILVMEATSLVMNLEYLARHAWLHTWPTRHPLVAPFMFTAGRIAGCFLLWWLLTVKWNTSQMTHPIEDSVILLLSGCITLFSLLASVIIVYQAMHKHT
jgi:hypothetical protein